MGRICDRREKGRLRYVCEIQPVWHNYQAHRPIPAYCGPPHTHLVDEGHVNVKGRSNGGPQRLVDGPAREAGQVAAWGRVLPAGSTCPAGIQTTAVESTRALRRR